jgi:hypothetical protein
LELCETLKLRYAYINTQKAPRRKDWEHDDDLDAEEELLEIDKRTLLELQRGQKKAAEERRIWEIKLVEEKKRALLKGKRVIRLMTLQEEKKRAVLEFEMIARSKAEEKAEERKEPEVEER